MPNFFTNKFLNCLKEFSNLKWFGSSFHVLAAKYLKVLIPYLVVLKTWNELPNHFRLENSFKQFKNLINSWNGSSCHCNDYR
jgi:hypothetical protein